MSALDQLLHQVANPSELAWNEETYDLALAAALSDAERATFVAKLIENAKVGDTRAIMTLGHLDADEAVPMLRAAAKGQDPWAPTARRALVLIGYGPDVIREIAHDAVHAPAKMVRVGAVMDLGKLGGGTAIAALREALADKDDAVRMLAWDAIVEVFDLGPLIRSPEGKPELSTHLELLQVLLSSDLPAFVRIGVDEMRALIDRMSAGELPQALGLSWAPNPAPELFTRLRLALFDRDAEFPVDEIAELTGVPRRLAETMIALRLQDQDPRVPEALTRLAATWTAPALEEIAGSAATSPELRAALTQSVRALRA
jgi:HEAT repeat protein